MKINGSAYFYIATIIVMLIVIVLSLQMEYFESKLIPLLVSGGLLILSVIGLRKEITTREKPEATVTKNETTTGKETGESWRGYLITISWIAGFILTIYLLGYFIAVPLFLLAYMKRLGTRWLTAIISATLSTAIIFILFETALGVTLHRGLIITWLTY